MPMHTKIRDVDYSNFSFPYLISSWFWVGKLPIMPGTWGSMAGIILGWILLLYTGLYGVFVAIIILTLLGGWAICKIEKHCGLTKSHDAKVFVVDEVAGQLIPMITIPMAIKIVPSFGVTDSIMLTIIAFLSFRLFDGAKIWPASTIDMKMLNGWGVMLDDIAAGVQAFIVCYAVMQYQEVYYKLIDLVTYIEFKLSWL